MAGKGVVRSIKNIAKGFSDVQIKVREATSNDPWGPSGTLMNEIAQFTFNESDFIEIMDMVDKRLNDKGKNWRHVFKALLLLDYCLHVGSENVVLYAKENIYVVKTLKEFQHVDESGKDVGANVRQKAKDITNLLTDDNRLKEERRQRQGMRDRMANISDYLNESVRNSNGDLPTNERYNEEGDLKKAIAESKRLAAEEAKTREQSDQDLQKALELSQQEALDKERKNKEKLEKENFDNLFNPNTTVIQQPLNPYQQQQQQQQQPQLQLEWTQTPSFNFNDSFNNPYQQQQQQQQPNPYLQQQITGLYYQQQQQQQQQPLQAQMTGFPTQQPSFQQSMVTGTNPFSQLNTTLQPEQKFDYSELVFGQPKPQQQQQQQTTTTSQSLFPPSNAPNFSSTLPSFTATTTTSNAPNFNTNITTTIASNAPNFNTPSASNAPNFSTLSASNAPNFNTTTSFTNNPSPSLNYTTVSTSSMNNAFMPSPQLSSPATISKPQSEADLKYAKLNALLANKDDGLDTFGNQGNLRIPYGSGFANSLAISPKQETATAFTNKNPFGQIQQNSPKPQKSLLDLMQEQKQQQQQQQMNNVFF